MKSLWLALQFMTRLPLPAIAADKADFARAIRWFPAAGLVVGGVVAGAAWLGALVNPMVAALAGLMAWVAITSALHLDGLGDIADAAGAAHKDRARLSDVLADPHIGSFGVTAIALQLAAKLVLLFSIWGQVPMWAIIILPMFARIGPIFWTLTMPPLHEGLGSRFRAEATYWVLALWLLPAVAAIMMMPALSIFILSIPLWRWWLQSRIGGISGDGHGAGIEITESIGLLALAVAAA